MKTEKPTTRRRFMAEREGHRPSFPFFQSAVVLFVGTACLSYYGGGIYRRFIEYCRYEWKSYYQYSLSPQGFQSMGAEFIWILALPLAVFAVLSVLILATVNKWKQGRKPHALGTSRSLYRTLFPLVAMVVGAVIITVELYQLAGMGLEGNSPQDWVSSIGGGVVTALQNWSLALLALGVIDFFWGRYQFEKSLYMTKQEIKDEMRQEYGDPRIKARRREIQQTWRNT